MLLDVVKGGGVNRVPATSLVVDVVKDFPRKLDIVVCELANLRIVNAQNLGILSRAKAESRDQVHDEEDKAGAAERVKAATKRVSELVSHLNPMLIEPAAVDV